MKLQIEMSEREVLDQVSPMAVSDHFKNHRDIDDLLAAIGVSTVARHMAHNQPPAKVIEELAEFWTDEECRKALDVLVELSKWKAG